MLCQNHAEDFLNDPKQGKKYFRCLNCGCIFLHPTQRVSSQEEKEFYLKHNNDIHDSDYQKFVKPLFDQIQNRLSFNNRGLDFGCGTGPVLAHLLKNVGYQVDLYDPYFQNDPSVFQNHYDFIVASEVFEHLYQPFEEIKRLHQILKPGGVLGIMTLMYDESIDFKNWFYRRDETHVVFYDRKTFKWIQEQFKFSHLEMIDGRTIILTKS